MKVPPAIEAKILAAAGLTPAKRSGPRSVETRASRRFVVEVDIPIYLRSEANTGGKVAARRARVTAIKAAVLDMMPGLPFMPFPAVVTITRFGTRDLWFQARSLLLETPYRAENFPERPMLTRAYRAARLAHFATLGGPQ